MHRLSFTGCASSVSASTSSTLYADVRNSADSSSSCQATLSAFKYDEYEKAVLFFNVIGTLLVFPVEIAMVVVRLWSSSERAEELENWVSTGMLISILLEDLPQLILQALYFAKSGRQVGAVNGSSIFFTTGGLLLSIFLSRIFIFNFWFTYVRPNNDKVKEANLGDFKVRCFRCLPRVCVDVSVCVGTCLCQAL